MRVRHLIAPFVLVPILVALYQVAQGSDMTSSNFGIRDSQDSAFGGTSSSSSPSFHLIGAVGDLAIGSSSANSFGLLGGFLGFMFFSVPIPTPTSTPTSTPGGGGGAGGGGFLSPTPTFTPIVGCGQKPDINSDGRVDLIDFSIMAFWWGKSIPSNSLIDLNCDGRLTLVDFSILAFYWTG